MAELSWKDAIIKVLQQAVEPMHYADISEEVLARGLRKEVGATPAQTVNAVISMSIKNDKATPFKRVSTGTYTMKGAAPSTEPDPESEQQDETGLINAFGMYWSRGNVLWTHTPCLLGRQAKGSEPVNFCGQQGVYLLHDRRDVVYVGRTTDQPLGLRLRQHVEDRLNGRWERFSWFGVYPVSDKGALSTKVGTYDLASLIITMEALLIEGLEPPQNRKRGDGFKAVEFIQVEDPAIQKQKLLEIVDALKSKL